jgi:hypothetical protein
LLAALLLFLPSPFLPLLLPLLPLLAQLLLPLLVQPCRLLSLLSQLRVPLPTPTTVLWPLDPVLALVVSALALASAVCPASHLPLKDLVPPVVSQVSLSSAEFPIILI